MGFKRTVSILVFIVFIIISVLSILKSSDTVTKEQSGEPVVLTETETEEETVIPEDIFERYPLIVVAAGIILTAAVLLMKDSGRMAFLIIYLLFIVSMTLAFREMGYSRGRLEIFWSYKQFFTSDRIRLEILNNIWLFVPLGAVLYSPGHKFTWIYAVLLSVWIELIQYETGLGLCEVDDVISNTLGTLIGYSVSFGMMSTGNSTKS